MPFINNSLSLLTRIVQKDPGVIVGPISKVLGYILNFIFNIASSLSVEHSLGISIIIFTFVVRAIMIPLAVKQQKSMGKMQAVQPEVEKIKKKYGDSKDPELAKKMNTEIQALYAKSGVNPLSGCLPVFIQFPIFIALSYVMQQSFRFITQLDDIYRGLVESICKLPNWEELVKSAIFNTKFASGEQVVLGNTGEGLINLQKALNKFSETDWSQLLDAVKNTAQNADIQNLFIQKNNIEFFLGINLLENPGYAFPAVLIPILSGVSTFFSSWLMNKYSKATDANAKMQQKVLLMVMPVMMAGFTVTMPAGVGLYWVVSSVFQILQQIVLNKYYAPDKLKIETAAPKNYGK